MAAEKISMRPLPDHVIVRIQKNRQDQSVWTVFAAGKDQELLTAGDEIIIRSTGRTRHMYIDGEEIVSGPATEFEKVNNEERTTAAGDSQTAG